MAQKQVVDLTPSVERSTEERHSEAGPQDHEKLSNDLLAKFNFAKASREEENGQLTPEQRQQFEDVQKESPEPSQSASDVVVERLVKSAEEVDRTYDRQLNELVELAGPPESAYETFREVVNTLLGGVQKAAGRLVTLLSYCYRVCKAQLTLSNVVKAASFVAVTGIVAGCLYKYLCESRFFEWLEEIGGWNGLARELASGIWDNTFGALFRGVRRVCAWVGLVYGAGLATRGGGSAGAVRGRAVVRAPGEYVDVGRVVSRRTTTVVYFTRGSVMLYCRRTVSSALTSSYRNPALAVGVLGIAGGFLLYSNIRERLR